MNNKCLGCGTLLQTLDAKDIGYCLNLNQLYCQRCFRLKHYNELIIDARKKISQDYLTDLLNIKKDALYCYVVDILSLRSFFKNNLLKSFIGKDVLILINKIDILPKNANIDKVATKVVTSLKKLDFKGIHLVDVYLTRKNDDYFKKIFIELASKYKEVIFCGNFNAGKSTLINFLSENNKLTTSSYPATTLAINSVSVDNLTYYDLPGSMDNDNFLMNIPLTYLANFTNQKIIKPLVYQVKGRQLFYLDGLFCLEVESKVATTIIFYLASKMKLTSTKKLNLASYHLKRSNFVYNIDKFAKYTFLKVKKKDYEIAGLGFISVFNADNLTINVPIGTVVYESEILL